MIVAIYQIPASLVGYSASLGDVLVVDDDGMYQLSVDALRADGRRSSGIVAQVLIDGGVFIQSVGDVSTSVSGLGTDAATSYVRASSTGRLERIAIGTEGTGDDLMGVVDPSGLVHLIPGFTVASAAAFVAGGDLTGSSTSQQVTQLTGSGSSPNRVVTIPDGTARVSGTGGNNVPATDQLRYRTTFLSSQTNTSVFEYAVAADSSPTFALTVVCRNATGGGTQCKRYDAAYTVERVGTGAPTVTLVGGGSGPVATGSLAGTTLTVDAYSPSAGNYSFRVRISCPAGYYSHIIEREGA